MPITSGLWWSVWWPWLVVWLVGATALVLAVAIWLRHLRRHRYRQRIKPVSPTTFYYIDDAQVRQLLGEMSPTEITEKRSSNMSANLVARLPVLSGGGGGGTAKGLTTKRTQQPTEIRAIRDLIETREQTDAIVYVDLRRGHVVENQALWKELARHGGHRPDSIRLSGLDPLVVLTARFKSIGGTKDKETSSRRSTITTIPLVDLACASRATEIVCSRSPVARPSRHTVLVGCGNGIRSGRN